MTNKIISEAEIIEELKNNPHNLINPYKMYSLIPITKAQEI